MTNIPGKSELVWTEERVKQFGMLESLLRDAAMIDRGSNCMSRINRVICYAEELNRNGDGLSFCNWIRESCVSRKPLEEERAATEKVVPLSNRDHQRLETR